MEHEISKKTILLGVAPYFKSQKSTRRLCEACSVQEITHIIPDQCIDLDAINLVERLQRLLNLPLVGLDVANENQGVVLLDLLHRALGVERVDQHLVRVQPWLVRNGFPRVFGRPREGEGLGSVEGCREADFARFLAVDLFAVQTVSFPDLEREVQC